MKTHFLVFFFKKKSGEEEPGLFFFFAVLGEFVKAGIMLDGAFTALRLLLLIGGASAVVVSPAENVTVSCRNFTVTANWTYSKDQPGTSFRVDIGGSGGSNFLGSTTDHRFDLSSFIWASEQRYMDNYYAIITAIKDNGQSSKPVKSKTFAFNSMKTVDIKCSLSFPPVDMTVRDSGATVSFTNPFHFYKELKQASKPDSAAFTFSFNSSGTMSESECTATEKICKHEINLPEGEHKCATLRGRLFDGMGVGLVPFNETEVICAIESDLDHWVVIGLVLAIAALIGCAVVVCICKAEAWTMNVPLPKPLVINERECDKKYSTVPVSDVVDVTVVAPQKDVDPPEELSAASDAEGGLSDGGNGEDAEDAGYRVEDESADDSVKTECVSIESEAGGGEDRAHYDRAHVWQEDVDVEVEMGDGEMITAYLRG